MRRAIAARSRAEAAQQLAALAAELASAGASSQSAAKTAPALVFAFPGQGAQQVGMGRGLYAGDPGVRAALDACCGHLRALGREDVIELLLRAEDSAASRARIERTELTQPLLFCVEYALARGLLARGLQPAASIGHSLGEYVAATLAGVFELGAAITLICRRGQLCGSAVEGAMLAVSAAADSLQARLRDGVGIAGRNAPEQTVLSGPADAIERLAAELEREGIIARRLPVSGAFHSALLDPLLDDFRAAVEAAQPRRVEGLRIASTLNGEWLSSDHAASPEYWVRHLRQPVDFIKAQSCLESLGEYVLIELGPGSTLGRLAQARSPAARSVTVLGKGAAADAELDRWFALPGLLWAHGAALDLSHWQQPARGRRVALPTYPFAKDRHWIEPAAAGAAVPQAAASGLEQWLQTQDWLSAPLPRPCAPAQISSVLVLLDAAGVGAEVAATLRERGVSVRTLNRGGALVLGDAALMLDPSSDAHWQALAALDAPSHLLDLWALDALDAPESVQQSLCFDWPLRMLQQLSAWAEREGGLVWLGASVNAQAAGDASALQPMQALRAGPLRTWPQEAPGVRSGWVDLDTGHLASPAVAARLLLEELDAGVADETVAWRGRRRLRPVWTPLGLPRLKPLAALKPGGRYLVSGAFGGAGQALVEHLAQLPQVELILLTRSPLPQAPEHPRRRWLAALQALGARVDVWTVDVADAEALQQRAEDSGLCQLDGAFHAAGVLDDGLIARKDLAAARRVLAPKQAGAEAIGQFAERRGAAFVLYFSSLSAQMGASGQVDYTAANAYLDAYAARADANSSRTRHIALAFSIWREAGMAARRAAELGLAPAPLADSLPQAHPLLKRRIDQADGRVLFGGVVDAHSDWVLDQHRLKTGEALLPGTAYVDLIAYALAELRGGFAPFHVEGLSFAAPFKLGAEENRRLELAFTPRGASAYAVEISSQGAELDDRIEHLSVGLLLNSHGLPEPLKLDAERSAREPRYAHPQLRFGPQWDCLRSLEADAGEAELKLARAPLDPASEALHPLHPALFDMAIGAAQAALAPEGIDAARLLPFRYGRLDVLAPLPAQLSSRQRARADGGDLVLDIDLLDADGQRVLALRDFVLRPARSLAAARPALPPARSVSGGANRLLEVGFRDGFSTAEALAAIDSVLGHSGPAQIALARRPVAELVADTRRPAAAEPLSAGTQAAAAAVPRTSGATPFVAAEGELQQRIVALWEGLLALSGIGTADDFFALGGHSLLLTRALSRLKRDHGLMLPIEAAFETPTVAAWSQLAEAAAPAPRGPALKRVDRSRYRADAVAG
jgi:malonyl CoA-acyl carrier protein transacylase